MIEPEPLLSLHHRTGRFLSVADIWVEAANEFKKPDRFTLTEVAEKYVVIRRLGARGSRWSRELTPYMVEPQNLLSSRELSALIFVGPAQSGKTESLILNWIAHSVIQDPMDMIVYSPTQQAASDFAIRRVDRMNYWSPALAERLIAGGRTESRKNKRYTSGMILTLGWPTVSELSGKPIGRVALTDYDRMDESIEGEGAAFDLAYMRTTTFGSFAMTLAESSPSRPIVDPRWTPETPHQAPPTTGILGLYNRGDRRRWYWPCPGCGRYFEASFRHLRWEDRANILDAADTVRMLCPECSFEIPPGARRDMQRRGVWLADGQRIDENGEIVGERPRSRFASFWLNGVAAGFVSWPDLVMKYLNAEGEWHRSHSEEALRQFFNNDLGEPYRPKAELSQRVPETLHARAVPHTELHVPPGVRTLVATVDVQKNAFVCQVHGVAPGAPYDLYVIDRFTIMKSNRFDEDGDRLWVKPGVHQEDWDLLIDEVILRTYPLAEDPARCMMIKLTICDSGGRAGVTTAAYGFYRRVVSKGLGGRFHLLKGEPRANAPRSYISYPDQQGRKDRFAASRGDVPVLFLNSLIWKDTLHNRLEGSTPGRGMIHFPAWLPLWFFKELCVERRTPKGWEGTSGVRNEAWDLLYYALGACGSSLLRIEQVDWQKPPTWADEPDKNPMVVPVVEARSVELTSPKPKRYDFARFGEALA